MNEKLKILVGLQDLLGCSYMTKSPHPEHLSLTSLVSFLDSLHRLPPRLAHDVPTLECLPLSCPSFGTSCGITSSESLPSSLSQAVVGTFLLCSPNKFYHGAYPT